MSPGQFFNHVLSNQVELLDSLHEVASESAHEHDFAWQMIPKTLFYAQDNFEERADFDLATLRKIVELCIRELDFQRAAESRPCVVRRRCEFWAMKALALVLEHPSLARHDQGTLGAVYSRLIGGLQRQHDFEDKIAPKRTMMLTGLSAHCLARINYENALAPEEASDLITGLVLPLAVKFLVLESRHEKSFCDDLKGDFHGLLDHHDMALTSEARFNSYPALVRFLLKLVELSDSGPRGYTAQFNEMLKVAIEEGEIADKHVVAINVLVAINFPNLSSGLEDLEQMLADLLRVSAGLHRAHIAFLLWKCFLMNHIYRSEQKDVFADHMVDDLATKHDELLHEIASDGLWDQQYDIRGWTERLRGRELALMNRLINITSKPVIYNMFLRNIECIEPDHAKEFDDLTERPILLTIDRLQHLTELARPEPDYSSEIRNCLECLGNFIRLRRHRLDEKQELRLVRTFEVLSFDVHLRGLQMESEGILLFANSFKVHPITWNLMVAMIRSIESQAIKDYLAQSMTADEKGALIFRKIVDATISDLLINDPEYIYSEIGSSDSLSWIYKYCERSMERGTGGPPLKEILFTWPQELDRTKSSFDEQKPTLVQFAELLFKGLEAEGPIPGGRYEMRELFFGLVALYSRHEQTLNEVLVARGVANRDSWLREKITTWIKLVVKDLEQGTSSDCASQDRELNPLSGVGANEYARLLIAWSGFKTITGRSSLNFCEHEEALEIMRKGIEQALKRAVDTAGVDSLKSARLRELQAELSSTL